MLTYSLMENHLHRYTVKRRRLKGSVKRRPLVDDPLSAGTFCFKAHRYSLFHGVPAAYCLPRQFADPEVRSVLLRTAGKQQDINRRLKIQLPKGVHLNRPHFKLWGRSKRPHPDSGRINCERYAHFWAWGGLADLIATCCNERNQIPPFATNGNGFGTSADDLSQEVGNCRSFAISCEMCIDMCTPSTQVAMFFRP